MIHNARPPATSRISFTTSGVNGAVAGLSASCERKKEVLQVSVRKAGLRAKLIERAGAANAPVGQEDEAIADALGIRELMNAQKKRAALPGLCTQPLSDFACLP